MRSIAGAVLAGLGVLAVVALLGGRVVGLRGGALQTARTDTPLRSAVDILAGSATAPAFSAGSAVAALDPEAYELGSYPDVVMDRDPDFGTPHFIRRRAGFLSPPPPGVPPSAILAAFVRANARVLMLAPSDLDDPHGVVARDYRTPGNGMRHVRWQQRHEGVDIFGAHLALNLTANHRIINVSSRALYLAEVRFHREERIGEAEAVAIARGALGGGEIKHRFKVRRVWYPLDMISAVMGWEVALEVHGNPEAHDFVIRADTGEVVFDQSLSWGLEEISLRVFTGDSPAPNTPGPVGPIPVLPPEVPREWVDLSAIDTNASPQGWIPGSPILNPPWGSLRPSTCRSRLSRSPLKPPAMGTAT